MQYINRDIADEDDIAEIQDKIDAILDILRMKGIIKTGDRYTDTYVDHWNVIDFRNDLEKEWEKKDDC